MGKCLAVYMFVWGIIVLVQAFFTNWAEFMAFVSSPHTADFNR